MDGFDLSKYLDIARRRIYWVIIPFLVILLGGLAYLLHAPKLYQAQTLILVQPQSVPNEYVRSLISVDVDARLKTISQQVTSRTNLEKIIGEHKLFDGNAGLNIENKVNLLRSNITIDVSKGHGRGAETATFTISYKGPDPRKVKQVTDALASNFITENLLIRESQAIGTSTFLADELESVRKQLAAKEEQLKQYRESFMGGLPEQLETNLRILERTQAQLDQLINRLRDLESRKIVLQKESDASEKARGEYIPSAASPQQPGEPRDLTSLRNQLASLVSKYTQNHPDVVRLKKTIAQLEAERVESEKAEGAAVPPGTSAGPARLSRADQTLLRQLQEVEVEIHGTKAEIERAKNQIKFFEKKIEDTPKREQELLSLRRDYSNLQESYNSLLKRKLEAEIAVSMEKKQQGEQFRVIDPAKVPMTPVAPDIPRIILMTLAVGLGLGAGLAYLMEMMDTSFKAPEDLQKAFKIPILVSIPIRYTDKELTSRKRRSVLKGASVSVGFVTAAVALVLASKGVDSTLAFIKSLIEKS
jgi:polysaccharide chain length determinant protein (PEP-CTERM system associated)